MVGTPNPDLALPRIDVITKIGPDRRAVAAAQVGGGEATKKPDLPFMLSAQEKTAEAIAKLNASSVIGDAQAMETALGFLVPGAAQSRLGKQKTEVYRAANSKGEWTPSLNREKQHIAALESKVQGRLAAADAEIVRLLGPENTTPERQLLGYDMQKNLYKRSINEKKDALGKSSDSAEKVALSEEIQAIEKKMKTVDTDRKMLIEGGVNSQGQKVEPHSYLAGAGDMVVGCAAAMEKKLNGGKDLDAEATAKIATDPIGHMEQILLQAVEDTTVMDTLVQQGLFSADYAKKMVDLIKMTKEEKQMLGKEKADKLQTAGCSGIALLFVMMYAASQREKAAKQRQM